MSEAPSRPRARRFRAEREFGLLVGGILAALGAWWLYREKLPALRFGFLAAGTLLVLVGALYPRALGPLYRAWMALAEALSRVVTTIVLGIVYYLVVTPIGLVKRLRGWDPLERRRPATAAAGSTFWRPYGARQHDPKHFDRMF